MRIRRMRSSSSSFLLIITTLILSLSQLNQALRHDGLKNTKNFQLVIGGGGLIFPPLYEPAPAPEIPCATPPPPPPPPPKVCPTPSPPPPPPSPPPPPPSPSPPPPHPPPPPPSPSPPPPHPPPPKVYPTPSPPPPPPSPPPPHPPPPPPPPSPSPSPPPPHPPPPSPKPSPVSLRVSMIAPVVKAFKGRLDLRYGPKDVLASWKGDNVCKYKGFACENLPDKGRVKAVSGVDFNGFGFRGKNDKLELGGFLDKLEDLVFFHANSNNFTGTLPDIDLSKIRFFYELDLSNNLMTGNFPKQVLQAKNLTFLDVRFNSYVGPIPREVFLLDVEVIYLNNNYFSGQIPDTLGKTPAKYLTFANNHFTGPIPSSIGGASETLLEVLFLNNKLSSCIPYQIGNLKKMSLFDASGNCLSGPIPQSFQCLRSIEILNFARNRLSGEVPESLCELGLSGRLTNLTLSNNFFTQVGPKCRRMIQKKYLFIDNNCIRDLPSQRPNSACEKFFTKTRCAEDRMMNFVPCKNTFYTGEEEQEEMVSDKGRHLAELADDRGDSSSSRASVSYAALERPKGRQ